MSSFVVKARSSLGNLFYDAIHHSRKNKQLHPLLPGGSADGVTTEGEKRHVANRLALLISPRHSAVVGESDARASALGGSQDNNDNQLPFDVESWLANLSSEDCSRAINDIDTNDILSMFSLFPDYSNQIAPQPWQY